MSDAATSLHRLLLALACLLALAAAAPAAAPAQDPGGPPPAEQDDWPEDEEDEEDEQAGAGGDEQDDGGEGGWPEDEDGDAARDGEDPASAGDEDGDHTSEGPPVTAPTVAGRRARLRANGKAAIPRGAPKRVRAIIAAANRIVGKPYKRGGGHRRLRDRGYDCSGTVSFALIGARILASPLVSGRFKRWGARGEGRWVTIYATRAHVYMEVAGLRLDTSPVGDRGGGRGPSWRPAIGHRRGFRVRHPPGL